MTESPHSVGPRCADFYISICVYSINNVCVNASWNVSCVILSFLKNLNCIYIICSWSCRNYETILIASTSKAHKKLKFRVIINARKRNQRSIKISNSNIINVITTRLTISNVAVLETWFCSHWLLHVIPADIVIR